LSCGRTCPIVAVQILSLTGSNFEPGPALGHNSWRLSILQPVPLALALNLKSAPGSTLEPLAALSFCKSFRCL
jgi:hypothetical protein